uniref:Uncharacterized protein n=1 Tax=Acrobeloides nanus TaxID=290746 RepID=A0A914BVY1_9BILA
MMMLNKLIFVLIQLIFFVSLLKSCQAHALRYPVQQYLEMEQLNRLRNAAVKRFRSEPVRFGKRAAREPIRFGKRIPDQFSELQDLLT